MGTPKEHVEEIRRNKFSIGKEPNPLIEDLHQAVKNLSIELYTKDVHFLMELIQNAEDNLYSEGVNPSLEFIITSKDITATGAPATLLIFNNEKGFSPKNVESICSVGRSTKKGKRSSGYIGEKGIGFKSVFLVTTQPYIFSNGYQICFNEKPCPHCGLGYVVPEWVEEKPTLQDIKQIYGSGDDSIPNTRIVLPLKQDKVNAVKQQLSDIHPEVLLFLLKIRHFSVREDNEDPKLNTANAISISSEINFVTRKNLNAESYTLHLSAEENGGSEKECSYYMWKQKFPVRLENVVERRMDVEELVVTLAFPNQERLHRGMSSPGVYAFLPTEMVTNFPFIIQADFVLASSRETILLDNKWNHGILECVPSAFVDAFKTLVIGSDQAPVSSLAQMFKFIPMDSSPYEKLNYVREKIKEKLIEENIIPIETYRKKKQFYKPREVGRLLPEFWNILTEASVEGVYLHNLSSHDGRKILSSSFDTSQYDGILNFLGVQQVKFDWYAKCIQSSNLVGGVSEVVYLKLLLFVAKNWGLMFRGSNMMNIPLFKYVSSDGSLSYCSVNDCNCTYGAKRLVHADPNQSCPCSWLISWNKEFACAANHFFMPEITQQAMLRFPHRHTLLEWLANQVHVTTLNVRTFAEVIRSSIESNSKLAIAYAYFLYHSFSKGYLPSWEVATLCMSMPLVDNYGYVNKSRRGFLVPANVSKWANLVVSNLWSNENYIELGKEYLHPSCYAGQSTDYQKLIKFLTDQLGASDIPDIYPPNAGFAALDTQLTKENAFLLLDWIQKLKYRGVSIPERFLKCVKEGRWLKVTVNGWMPPSKSFLIGSSLGRILQSGSVLVDIPLVDESFYGNRIHEYEKELKTIGVMFSYEEACEFIGRELMHRAASFILSRGHVILMLKFIQCQRQSNLPVDKFVNSIRNGSWLKTSHGLRSPVGSVLYDLGWEVASQISSIPFIDQAYFGEEIYNFKEEFKLLGVIVGFSGNYKVVIDHLKPPYNLTNLTAKAVLLIMECIKYSAGSSKLINSLKGTSCLKTNMGFKTPGECFLYDPAWGCILEVFYGLPVIDNKFYGEKIFTYKGELKQIGVGVDFEEAIEKSPSNLPYVKAEVVLLIMEYIKYSSDSSKLINSLKGTYCLKTNMGFKTPGECFLYDPVWGCILEVFSGLPVIDHKLYGQKIFTYKDELKQIGVVVDFEEAIKKFAHLFKQNASQTSFNQQHVKSFLSCCRQLKLTRYRFPADLLVTVRNEKWLLTRVGSYRCPRDCILDGVAWKSISSITRLPFVDDSDNGYGKGIHEYKEELKSVGVVTELKDGVKFVPKCLTFPSDPSIITLESVFSLLQCIRLLMQWSFLSIEDDFRKRLSRNWLKTHVGYRPPDKCLLYDSKWKSFLKPTDGPFIDENFYGPEIAFYKIELNAIGVTIDVEKGCFLVASHLDFLSDYNTIVKIYRYLSEHNWKPEDKAARKIWIPESAKWAYPEECVIYDQHNLFGSKFYVLADIYDKKILPFFYSAMEVRGQPSLDDYVHLWNDWESSVEQLSYDKCCKFWMFMLKHLNTNTEKKLCSNLVKLPATSGNNEIFLLDRNDVFIPDNLHLKKLFEQEKVFVWYPQNLVSSSRCNLFDLYRKIGARNISESICMEEPSLLNGVHLKQINLGNICNVKGLVRLILGFLACSSLKMEPNKRHEAVQGLLNLSIFETKDPVTVSYSLSLSSGDIITKKANRMIRWERQSSKFFTQKMNLQWHSGNPSLIKYATYFSEAISEGVLRENHDHVPALTELITLAFVLNFNNKVIEFLMESKNLQIFNEDDEFLRSVLPFHLTQFS
ncbi:hypothetical protein E2542_SST05005 [Spatholobus suberectus]|nr:hypothetical protein E2542_SST05005 [Spatholobus suberectus]